LVKAIKLAKEKSWKQLSDQVDSDPWGLPYKMVMGKLGRKPPEPNVVNSGVMLNAINALFPVQPLRDVPKIHVNPTDIEDITQEELKNAANSLKLNKSPGPDGISNDLAKLIARTRPDILIGTYNKCLH